MSLKSEWNHLAFVETSYLKIKNVFYVPNHYKFNSWIVLVWYAIVYHAMGGPDWKRKCPRCSSRLDLVGWGRSGLKKFWTVPYLIHVVKRVCLRKFPCFLTIFHREVTLFTYIRVSNIEKYLCVALLISSCFSRWSCNGSFTAIMLVRKTVA